MNVIAWGTLPVALPLLVWCAHRLAWLAWPHGRRTERVAATAVLAMGLVHATVGLLGEVGALGPDSVLAALAVETLAAWGLSRGKRPRPAVDGEAPLWAVAWAEHRAAVVLIALVCAAVVVVARLVPVWQWDSYGYHLPFVNFVLQHGGFAGVPADVHYISTYPHNIELGMIWVRAFLPDDRLIDLAQVPYGLAGAALTAATARTLGATRSLALLSAAAWLTVPAVFLQLPTNYVDVGTAAALLGAVFFLLLTPVSARALLLGGLALGLFLGSKPSAPIAVAFVAAVTAIRAARHHQVKALLGTAALTLVFGAQMYLVMWLRHGNPVWPVAVKVGPWSLAGDHTVDDLLASGAAVPHATGPLLERLWVSWLAVGSSPVFDMKLGGLGPVFLAALPLAVVAVVRRRDALVVAALAATMFSPDPSIARYVLALPALVFALGAAALGQARGWPRWAVQATAFSLMGWQLWHAWPGFVGDGPKLDAFVALSDDERRTAVGPFGRPTDYPPAWARVDAGESAAFDAEFEFPGLLWSPDLRYPVFAVPRGLDARRLREWGDEHRVKLWAVGGAYRDWLQADSAHWQPLFECRSGPCTVFVRRPGALAQASSGRR